MTSGGVLKVTVSSVEEVKRRTKLAFSGVPQGSIHSFASLALLWKALAPKRWEMLQAMCGNGPMSVRSLARLLGRDVKGVHIDVQMLLKSRVIRKVDGGGTEFPFDSIHVDFLMKAA